MDYAALGRRVEHIEEAIENHFEECNIENHNDCERCKNILEYSHKLVDDFPTWMYVVITIAMCVRHPLVMIKRRGSLRAVIANFD